MLLDVCRSQQPTARLFEPRNTDLFRQTGLCYHVHLVVDNNKQVVKLVAVSTLVKGVWL